MQKYWEFLICLTFALINLSQSLSAQTGERKKPELKDFGSSLTRSPEENLAPKKVSTNQNSGTDDVIQIDTNLVVMDLLVLDKKGRQVYGLKKEDFTVTEDNQTQEISTFSLGDDANVPRSIVLIIDYSSSQLLYIERSIEAAKLLVDKLQPNDLMAIVTDDVELIAQFTGDKVLLKEKLESLKQSALNYKVGKSKQFSSLYAVLNEMFNEEDVRPIILFQTDGDQFGRLKDGYYDLLRDYFPPSQYSEISNFTFDNLLSAIEKNRATIYTIVPGFRLFGLSPEERLAKSQERIELQRSFMWRNPPPIPIPNPSLPTPQQLEESRKMSDKRMELTRKYYPNGLPDIQEVLARMSNYSGGWIDFLEKPEQAEDIYNRIFSDVNTRYVIGYNPTNEAKDGKRRLIKIRVKKHSNYVILGKKSYLAKLNN